MQIEIQNNEEDQVVTPEVVVEGEVIEGQVLETEDENAEIVISLGDEVVTPKQEEDRPQPLNGLRTYASAPRNKKGLSESSRHSLTL